MEIDIKQWVEKYWLLFFVAILFVFMALFKISLKAIWKAISSLELWQLLLIILIYFLISAFLILARRYLLYSLSYKPKLKNLVYIHFSTMAAHYSTPAKLGFPLTVYLFKRFDNVPYATGTTMILIELFVSTGICGIIALLGSFFYFSNSMKPLVSVFFWLFVIIVPLIGVSFVLMKSAKNSRVNRFIKDVHGAFADIAVNHLIIYVLITFFVQLLGSINLVLMSSFLSSELSIFQALIASSAAFFLGAISMIPMGLGVREASMLFYLHHVGITNEIGLSIVTIQRLLSTGLSFVLGTLFGAILGMKNIRPDFVQEPKNVCDK